MHRLTLGDFELTAVSDGNYRLDGGAFFGVVPKVMWEKKVKADAENYVPVGLNSIVVRTGQQTVLIETGIGNKLPERMIKIFGQPAKLLDNLVAAGVSPEDIDIVINSHLHYDHCGWNTLLRGDKIAPTFPKAKYYAPEGEWRHGRLQLERDAISYLSENYDPLIKSGQMDLLQGDREIVPGNFGQGFSRPHRAHASRDHQKRRPDGMLHLRSDSEQRPHRSDLGHGLRSAAAPNHREPQALLRAVHPREMADHVHPRSEHPMGICAKEMKEEKW